ncbi:MAG TPA: winged helix DNA-binding domain-containing protein, partial [Deinococcales bacterium]|nr:winged helix DNA-binding domain-containing protein [Deinococcales bacterium]
MSLPLPLHRLAAQGVSSGPWPGGPGGAARRLAALQGQAFGQACWALGLRSGTTQAGVEASVAAGDVVFTWLFRGTIFATTREDLRDLLGLCAARNLRAAAPRLAAWSLDGPALSAAARIVEGELSGGRAVARNDLLRALEDRGIPALGGRGYRILWTLSQQGLICFGPRAGKEQSLVLLDEWVPRAPERPREEVLAGLAERYFATRGPATIRDFAWWADLPVTEARAALAAAGDRLEVARDGKVETAWTGLEPPSAAGRVELLPGFDEILLGYQDRSGVLPPEHADRVVPGGNGMFLAFVVDEAGIVTGTWKAAAVKRGVTITLAPF